MKVAQSSYLAGFAGSSNVLAGKKYPITTVGTMAHSFVTSLQMNSMLFGVMRPSFPETATLLKQQLY